ncbi:MAG: hypothetical protein JWR52_2210 [Marmoricola sp.]|nr:hypothetical protein [Marmoricola sp.]
MIAALLVLGAAVLLAAGFFADVHVLGWIALGVAAVAVVLVLLPTRGATPDAVAVAEPDQTPEPDETPDPEAVPEPEPAAAADLVLVIPGRRRFHKPGCELLAGHDVEKLTEEEAREEEFTACTRCVK